MMKDLFTLQNLEQVKALTDPLRQRILTVLCREPMTTKQVAQRLGEKPTRLYHHVATLEQAGLVRIVETRPKRGTVEKYYQAVACQFRVDRSLFTFAGEGGPAASGAHMLIINEIQDTLRQFQDERTQNYLAEQTAADRLVFARAQGLRVTPEQIADLEGRIDTWLEECATACETAADDAAEPCYTLTLILYPTFEEGNKSG